jgi:polar amino acid transport system substrate-binding protein
VLRRVASLCLLALLLGVGTSQPVAAATRLLLCFEDSDVPPWRMRDQSGLNFVLLNGVARRLGLRFEYRPLPWRRCQDDLLSNRADGAFGMSWTHDRARVLRYPDGAPQADGQRLFVGGYVLLRRRGNAVRYDGQRILGLRGSIGVQRGTSITQDLRRQGLPLDDSAPDVRSTVLKLAAGRVDAAAIGTDQAERLLASDAALRAQVEIVQPPLIVKPYFLVFSPGFAQRHPQLVQRIWAAVTVERESAAYRQHLAEASEHHPQ